MEMRGVTISHASYKKKKQEINREAKLIKEVKEIEEKSNIDSENLEYYED